MGLVTSCEELAEALSQYVSGAAVKLRRQKSVAELIHVYIRTNPHRKGHPQYCQGLAIPLPQATDDTMALVRVALWGLKRIYRPGYEYQKAGVTLSEIVPAASVQLDMFSRESRARLTARMGVLDAVNRKMGKQVLRLASDGLHQRWAMKSGNKSPAYTTRWTELPVAVAA